MSRTIALVVAICAAVLASTHPVPTQALERNASRPAHFDLFEASIPDIVAALDEGRVNSKQLVSRYFERIIEFEGDLNAFISVNPRALLVAHLRDIERRLGHVRGPLHGVPIVLKDNIQTRDGITTGGALAFRRLRPPYEATLVQKLRDAGAIVLGKTVMTELANWVSDRMPGNYSAIGGYGMNPYDPRPDPRHILDASGMAFFDDGRPVMATGGSSSGIATSANLAAANVGTETSGSILSPSNQTMLAGVKPTVGLISRYGVIPITADQDTAGPMARDVASAAVMLGVMQGFDPNDPATEACQTPGNCFDDYTQFLSEDGLQGARIGVPRVGFYDALNAAQKAVVDEAVTILEAQGATVIFTDIPSQVDGSLPAFGICASGAQRKGADENCSIVLKYGFKRDFNAWLDSLGDRSDIDSLSELIAFNLENEDRNAIRYGQARLDISEEMDVAADEARYLEDRARDLFLAATHGMDEVMAADDLDALLFGGATGAGIAARPGYPTVIVPFGFVPNALPDLPPDFDPKPQPFGISFSGTAFTEPTLLRLAYAFEQASQRRVPPESAPPLGRFKKNQTTP